MMSDLKIVSVNCQGLGDFKKRKDVFQYYRKLGCNILCLQDTHFIWQANVDKNRYFLIFEIHFLIFEIHFLIFKIHFLIFEIHFLIFKIHFLIFKIHFLIFENSTNFKY